MERKWVSVLFGKERERENFYVELTHFLPGPTQNLSLRNGEKIGVKMPIKEERQN